jgi:hypothetical protein
MRLMGAEGVLCRCQHFPCKPHAVSLAFQVGDQATLSLHLLLSKPNFLSRRQYLVLVLCHVRLLLGYGRPYITY